MQKSRLIALICLFSGTVFLSACGQKGALFIVDTEPTDKGSTLAAPAQLSPAEKAANDAKMDASMDASMDVKKKPTAAPQ